MIYILKHKYNFLALIFKVVIILFMLLSLCCNDGDGRQNFFVDIRNDKRYKIIKIDDIVLMAENLNYDTLNSKCYGYDDSNCAKYGRLYDWESAMKVCPNGWHLPSRSEWNYLIQAAGGTDSIASKISALPGGIYYPSHGFLYGNEIGYWWTATESWSFNSFDSYAYDLFIRYDQSFGYIVGKDFLKEKFYGHSVRCAKDYISDSITAMQVKKESKKISSFKSYENYLDSLLKIKHKTIPNWCKIVEKDTSVLRKYSSKNFGEDYILKYYNEHCVEPLEAFEKTITGIDFRHTVQQGSLTPSREASGGISFICSHILVTKTVTGAIAKYKPWNSLEYLEVKISLEEWKDFIRALHRCNIGEWEKKEYYTRDGNWVLKILSSEKYETDKFKRCDLVDFSDWGDIIDINPKDFYLYHIASIFSESDMENWTEFMKIIDDIEKKVWQECGNKKEEESK